MTGRACDGAAAGVQLWRERRRGGTAGLLWAGRGARLIFCAHVNHVFATLNLRDRAAAVIFALDHDIAGRGS